jgi:hypothetical protein
MKACERCGKPLTPVAVYILWATKCAACYAAEDDVMPEGHR